VTMTSRESVVPCVIAPAASPGTSPPRITPSDLAELMGAFNEVTARLEASHTALREEVARLTRDLHEANEQLERSRRLAALGEMAAGIAHEVRNPLGGVRLYARMLEEDLADRPAQRDIAVKILRASRAVEDVVRDVLTFARELRVHRESVDVCALLDRAVEDCRHDGVAGWKGVEIVRDDSSPQLVAMCDASLMGQALTNIIRNAFEAMAETPAPVGGHRLLIRAAQPSCGARADRAGVLISIMDTGPGVTADVVARMFNPFFTTRSSGTGLGLAIVHRIVDAHAGRVSVRARDDEPGTALEVVLPAEPQRRTPPGGGSKGKKKVIQEVRAAKVASDEIIATREEHARGQSQTEIEA